LRQGLSVGIGVGGVLLLTRFLGPANYGLYAGALAITMFLYNTAILGVDVYLVRREGPQADVVYHQAFSFLLLSGICVSAVGVLISPLLGHWLGDTRFLAPLQVMLLSVPITVLYVPPRAQLERALDFRKIAGIELAGQLLLYALSLPLAWRGFGVWAPVAGYFVWQLWMLGSGYALTRYRPRWHWSSELLREMVNYSVGYWTSTRVWALRRLVNPLIVGHFLGPQGVGYVALTVRIVEVLSFVKDASWRLSIVALAKVQGELPRLRRGLEEAMGLQSLALGPLLAGFAVVAPWLLPVAFGDDWTPVLSIYPFIALGYFVNAVFSMHSSVLYVLKHNREVLVFNVVHVVLFAGGALLLVPWLGLQGYGLAEVVALGSYLVIHVYVARLFAFSYERSWPWLMAFVPPLFVPLVGLPWGLGLCVCTVVVALSKTARSQLGEYWTYVGKIRKKNDESLQGSL
jgi:O-antigen/teichoic acid export membrane protein